MDNIIAECSDVMVNSLNFGLPETAQYVTSRRLVNYFPSGSNVYAPNAGNKQIRFLISKIQMLIEQNFFIHWVDCTHLCQDID